MSLSARQKELLARHLLAHQDKIAVLLKEKRWAELAVLAEFAAGDAPRDLAQTDPSLYRLLRQQITEYRIRGWQLLDVTKLMELAAKR